MPRKNYNKTCINSQVIADFRGAKPHPYLNLEKSFRNSATKVFLTFSIPVKMGILIEKMSRCYKNSLRLGKERKKKKERRKEEEKKEEREK